MKEDKTNRALFRLEKIIGGDFNVMRDCLEKLMINTKIGNDYLKANCPACKCKSLLIKVKDLHWTWECTANECERDGRYNNLLGLIKLFGGDNPIQALEKLTRVVVVPVAEFYGDERFGFGKYKNKCYREATPAYLMWALHEAECITIQQRERIRAYLFGNSIAA